MFKLIIGILMILCLSGYEGVNTYKNVENLSQLGSLINVYLTIMTSVLLISFGLDNIFYK